MKTRFKTIISVAIALMMVFMSIMPVYAAVDLSKRKDANGVYPKYPYSHTGSSRADAIQSAALTWSGPEGDIKKPIAGFSASGDGKSATADSGNTLTVQIGTTVRFTDTSKDGHGNVDFYDMQIHSSDGDVLESTHGSFISSYTFDEANTYTVYLNVYDDTESWLTRGWGNYAANGSHVTVSPYNSTYGTYHFVKLQIQVVDQAQGVMETHFLWNGSKWVTHSWESHVIESEDVGESIKVTRLSELDDGENYAYLGYTLGDNNSDSYRSGNSYTATPDAGEVIYVNFHYTMVEYVPPAAPPSGGGDSDKFGSSGSNMKVVYLVFKHYEYPYSSSSDTLIDDNEWTVYIDKDDHNAEFNYQYDYYFPEIEGYKFYKVHQTNFKVKEYDDHVTYAIGPDESMDGRTYSQNIFTYKKTSSGGDESGYIPVEPDRDPPDPDTPDELEGGEEPDTYPSVSVDVSLSTTGTTVNYKTLAGTVKGSATANATVHQGDIRGSISTHMTSVGLNNYDSDRVYNDITNSVSTSNTSNTVTISREVTKEDIGSLLIGTPGVSTEYEFYMIADSKVELNKSIGGVPITGFDYDGGTDTITLDNMAPKAEVTKLVTLLDHYIDADGNRVEVEPREIARGHYYKNTPILFNSLFTDAENDMSYTTIQIGKGNTVGQSAIYIDTIGVNPQTGIDVTLLQNVNEDVLYKTERTKADNYNYNLVYTPLQEGDYWYRIYCYDAKELLALTKRSNIVEGTFTVKSEPAPPVADVTEPSFAYEKEKVNFEQNSTDPNGIDDILKYEWTFPDIVTPAYEASNPAGKEGGTLTFPEGSSGNIYEIKVRVTDATELSDEDTIEVKVIDQIPIARLEILDNEANDDRTKIKENRKLTISAANSLQPKAYPILWNESTWTIEAVGSGAKNEYINWDESNTNGNKQRVLQFDKPGKYRVTIDLVNQYSKNNPDSPDIAAAKAKIDITVYEDKAPVVDVAVTSNKPNFTDNPVECVTVFNAEAESLDNDTVKIPSGYNWVIYEDKNNDGKFTDDEVLPTTDYTCDSTNKVISITTKFETGSHNYIKAVAVGTETFGQPYIEKLLPDDGSWLRQNEDFETYVVNWVPDLELIPDQGPSTKPSDEFNPDPGTPYEDVDINGDGITDGKFIRAYTDDIFSLKTKITDELPDIATMSWELEKKNHSGTYDKTDGTGKNWIRSSKVTHTLGHDGGTMRIDSPGIYKLTGTVTDDCGETAQATIYVRVYTLPQAVLDTNPKYQMGGEWITKENIRFDLRSTPTIVDDEWGKAWHTMDWSKDNWDVIPKEGQDVSEIHFMDEFYTTRYNDQIIGDLIFSGRNSPIGFGIHEVSTIELIAMPGLYGMYNTEGDTKVLSSSMRDDFYEAVERLADQVREICPYHTVNVIKAPAFDDVFVQDPYETGFFSGFLGDAEDENNKYLVETSNDFTDTEALVGTSSVTGNLDAMITDGALDGWVDIKDAYNINVPESVNNLPYDDGDVKVYMSLYKVDEGDNKVYTAEKVLIAEGTCEADLKQVVMMERTAETPSWTIKTKKGLEYTGVTGYIQIETEFTNDADDANITMMAEGWAGTVDEYWQTQEVSLVDAYNRVNTKPGAYKFILYANNNYGTDLYYGDIATNEDYQEALELLRSNGMYIVNYGAPKADLVDGTGAVVGEVNQELYFKDLATKLTYDGVNHSMYKIMTSGANNSLSDYVTNDVYEWVKSVVPNSLNAQYRSCSFTEPGTYEFKYWGTNYGGKVTTPVVYKITVIPDLPPNIHGEVLAKFYRDPNDGNRATIALLGPYSNLVRRQALTVESVDGDYIDFTKITVTYDSNNNKQFTDATDTKWFLEENGTNYNGMDYTFKRLAG